MFDAFKTSHFVSEENTPLYKNILPEESFIKFDACKLRNASIAWINFDLMNELGIPVKTPADIEALKLELLQSFAYMIPNERDDPNSFDFNDKREFLAERYGDFGEQCNGGGVRCGLNGNFQSKGIGRSLLAGRQMDFWHTHGGATIEEGIREAIWSEVFDKELPFGAVRILAVIATGKATAYDYGLLKKEDQNDPPGGLMIRQANLRPAHYQRAPFYKPLKELGEQFVHDSIRTEKALRMIDKVLPVPNSDSYNEIIAELKVRAEKFAKQVAYSKMMRLAHGSLTQGNIDFSGKYIDFGTTTALSGYGNPIVSRGFPSIWLESEQLAGNLTSLVFYSNKYLNPDQTADVSLISNDVEQHYCSHYDKSLAKATLMITGFPLSILVDNDQMSELANLIIALARENTLNGKPLGAIPDSLGGCDIIGFFQLAASKGSELSVEQCANDVRQYKDIERLVVLYCDIYTHARAMMLSLGVAGAAFKKLLLGRIAQYAIDLSTLYRDRLQGNINVLIDSHAVGDELFFAINEFVSKILDTTIRTREFFSEFEFCKKFVTLQDGLAYRLEIYSSILSRDIVRYVFADGYFSENKLNDDFYLMYQNTRMKPVRIGQHWGLDFDSEINFNELTMDIPQFSY